MNSPVSMSKNEPRTNSTKYGQRGKSIKSRVGDLTLQDYKGLKHGDLPNPVVFRVAQVQRDSVM